MTSCKKRKTTSTPLLHNSIAETVYNEIVNRSSRYYYYLGSVRSPRNIRGSSFTADNDLYERDVRRNMVMVKEIGAADVSFIIPRIDWNPGVVYDMYDDNYSDKIIGVDLVAGGSGYTNATTRVEITGNSGERANIQPIISNGSIVGFDVVEGGNDFLTNPELTITGSGNGAIAYAVTNHTIEGDTNIYNASFYVLTSDNNIYKCLDNNGKIESTDRPTETTPEPFRTADGYMWKFMGTIPTFLSNKFLTQRSLPVRNALTEAYYSSGEIKSVVLDNGGQDYTFATIDVIGDGFLGDNPILVTGLQVSSPGMNYTTATLVVDPPVPGAVDFASSAYIMANKTVRYQSRYYKAVNTGYTGSVPVHTNGIQVSGNVNLQYVGEGITGNLTITGGQITGITDLRSQVVDIILTNSGSGYISPPDIDFIGSSAVATSSIVGGHVSSVSILDGGTNIGNVSVIIGDEWVSGGVVAPGDQIFYQSNLYTVSTGGTLDTVPPVHTTGSVANGSAVLDYAGTPATGYVRSGIGRGYDRVPSASVLGDGEGAAIFLSHIVPGAVLTPVITNGSITNIIVANGGEGYSTAELIINGDGTGAQAHTVIKQLDIRSNQATSELIAKNGAIHVIKIVSGGYGYNQANVTISGDGINATADAIVQNGRVTGITVTNEGSDYTFADVLIDGNGFGATARAILPPIGGHGKDPVSELYSGTLAFYSTMGMERIRGLDIDNDYRQFGILKNVRSFDNKRYYNDSVGYAVWTGYVTSLNTTIFKDGVIVTRRSDKSEFLIVASSSDTVLLIPLSGKYPAIGDVMQYMSDSFSLNGIVDADIDIWSGSMMLIDNRVRFTSSQEEKVLFRTNITY